MNINILRLNQYDSVREYFKESWNIFLLAIPLILIQLCSFSKGLSDMIMVGHINEKNLAAISIAGAIYGLICMFTGGFMNSTITVLSKLYAEEDYEQMHYWGHQALYLNTILTFLVAILVFNLGFFISFLDISTETKKIASEYLHIIGFFTPFFGLLNVIRPIMQTFLKNKVLLYVLIAMSALNVPLNYLFIYVLDMGAAGSAAATAICFSLEVVGLYIYIRPNEQMNIFKNYSKPNFADMWSLFKLGYTIGLSIMVELGVCALIIILLTKYGETTIAAHQVAFNYTNIIFTVALGLRFAVMRKISFLLGLKQVENIQKTIIGALIFSFVVGIFFIVVMLLFSDYIIYMYTESEKVMEIAKSVLFISLFYQMFNSMLTTAIGVLRAYKKNNDIFKMTIFSYFIVGFGVGYALSLYYGLQGFWVGLALCLFVMNIVSYKKVYEIVWLQKD